MSPEISAQPTGAEATRPGARASRAWPAWRSWSSSWRAGVGTAMPARRSSRNGPTRRRCRRSASCTPASSANQSSLDLPGRLEAYTRAPIYARVGGFLKAWHVDIGAPVKAGQLLAEIEAPDLDQQLLQAKATLASAQASRGAGDRHGGALAAARRRQHRVAPDRRREDRRPHRQAGADQGRAGRGRSPGGALCLQAPDGALRRHRDGAQHRCRRADRCRVRAPVLPCS